MFSALFRLYPEKIKEKVKQLIWIKELEIQDKKKLAVAVDKASLEKISFKAFFRDRLVGLAEDFKQCKEVVCPA